MDFGDIEIVFLGIALGCDAFAVGLGVGTRFCAPRQIFRLSFHFGLFQFFMPVAGWYLGKNLVGTLQNFGTLVACGLLVFLGARMIHESVRSQRDEECGSDPTRGFSLVVLSLATSIDALGVGFSLGILGGSLLVAAMWIGIIAGAMTWTAMKLGNRLSQQFGKWIEATGGVILLLIAAKLIIT